MVNRTSRAILGTLPFLILAACSSNKVTTLSSAAAKPFPCDLDFYGETGVFKPGAIISGKEEPPPPHEKLCAIYVNEHSAVDPYGRPFGNSATAAKTKLEKDACACGADAVIIKAAYGDRGRYIIEATGIRYLSPSGNAGGGWR